MAGTDSRFDAAAFRTNIRFAMNMGLPSSTSERATFQWDVERTFDVADAGDNPFDWTEAATTEVTRPDVQIPVALQFATATPDLTPMGEFDASRVILTVLDEDFALLTVGDKFANKVEIDGSVYDINFVAPPVGLFDVTVYQIHIQARDEK